MHHWVQERTWSHQWSWTTTPPNQELIIQTKSQQQKAASARMPVGPWWFSTTLWKCLLTMPVSCGLKSTSNGMPANCMMWACHRRTCQSTHHSQDPEVSQASSIHSSCSCHWKSQIQVIQPICNGSSGYRCKETEKMPGLSLLRRQSNIIWEFTKLYNKTLYNQKCTLHVR